MSILESEIKTSEDVVKEEKLKKIVSSIGAKSKGINYSSLLNGYSKNQYNEEGYNYLDKKNVILLRHATEILNRIYDKVDNFKFEDLPEYINDYKDGSVDDRINKFIVEHSKIIKEYIDRQEEQDNYKFEIVAYTHFLLRVIYNQML